MQRTGRVGAHKFHLSPLARADRKLAKRVALRNDGIYLTLQPAFIQPEIDEAGGRDLHLPQKVSFWQVIHNDLRDLQRRLAGQLRQLHGDRGSIVGQFGVIRRLDAYLGNLKGRQYACHLGVLDGLFNQGRVGVREYLQRVLLLHHKQNECVTRAILACRRTAFNS